ncbi:hypothetical protein V0288_21995 [Pannus brasiliensis CCIBt3594]|uniref:Uncharacterized protein n=1 Tax=Pannus brasiliensis CCIBt3594 TaxID=1427578 RepID=A0AAW9QZG5_9CHRO
MNLAIARSILERERVLIPRERVKRTLTIRRSGANISLSREGILGVNFLYLAKDIRNIRKTF